MKGLMKRPDHSLLVVYRNRGIMEMKPMAG